MSNMKQVKVDNWGFFMLGRLKHFFNRTDYCDLTLQFQDNAQLKVHRLVLSACTEYFELLERTCEMYEDCLVMPEDLQADVIVPIVNFMYTGQLDFKLDLLEKLYQTSLVLNIPVLSKLLDVHRNQRNRDQTKSIRPAPVHSYSKHSNKNHKQTKMAVASSSGIANKRTYNKSLDHDNGPKPKRPHSSASMKSESYFKSSNHNSDTYNFPVISERNKHIALEPRPTRYELPEELDEEHLFDNSFTSISYTSKPLMIHPETVKQYGSKKLNLFEDATTSTRLFSGSSNDIVECRKITMNKALYNDDVADGSGDDSDTLPKNNSIVSKDQVKDASQLFDQIIKKEGPKVTIETKPSNQGNTIDHAKIISEVLKKYPHLVKGNKNIKLKILNTPNKTKRKPVATSSNEENSAKEENSVQEIPDFTYETDVIDSKEAARLIAMGAENTKGPWICLICGTPGRALHFTSYYKFRRHLVEIHNEKPVASICEYCGLKSLKRNYLLHHMYTKHGIDPPPNYHFPKCNYCNYVALTEAFLVKHKSSHTSVYNRKGFRCNACATCFETSNKLLAHIQTSGHKYSADRKTNLQCIYCFKMFLREANLYNHLKANHKRSAKADGIIDDSDEEKSAEEDPIRTHNIKNKPSCSTTDPIKSGKFDNLSELLYEIEHKDGNIQLVTKKSKAPATKTKILNSEFNEHENKEPISKATSQTETYQDAENEQNDFLQEVDSSSSNNNEDILVIDNQEYIIQNYQLIPKKDSPSNTNEDYSVSQKIITQNLNEALPTLSETPIEFHSMQNIQPETSGLICKKNTEMNQSIQIVVSNEEEYKALMASNPSIIFEDANPNKTLAVLAAQNGAMETNTIDLETTQSNEMMIIPDNYPISVSETVSTDNTNIVVVYSHAIDDHNKQYQLITSQGLEAQFVQSSAMITQNFETITTCAPIMNAHVINTSQQTWNSNINENIEKMPIITPMETQDIHPNIVINNLNQLQLSTDKEMHVEVSEPSVLAEGEPKGTQDLQNEQNTIITISQEIKTDNPPNSEPLPNDINSLGLLDQNVTSENETPSIVIDNPKPVNMPELGTPDNVICHFTACQTNNETADSSNVITNIDTLDTIHDEDIHTGAVQHEEVIDNQIVNDNQENGIVGLPETLPKEVSEVKEPHLVEQEEAIITEDTMPSNKFEVVENITNVENKKPSELIEVIDHSDIAKPSCLPRPHVKENIQNLTSEWSEDEGDSQQVLNTSTPEVEMPIEGIQPEIPEVEESIENIQQEIDKHTSTIVMANLAKQALQTKQDKPLLDSSKQAVQCTTAPDPKLTSLLNDWDDNDSQEENDQQNNNSGNEDLHGVVINHEEHAVDIENKPDEITDSKNDKIKRLVSDWDEDD